MTEKNMANFLHKRGGLAARTVLLIKDYNIRAVAQILCRSSRPAIGNVKLGSRGFRQINKITEIYHSGMYRFGQRKWIEPGLQVNASKATDLQRHTLIEPPPADLGRRQ